MWFRPWQNCRRLLRLAESQWRYSTPPPHGTELSRNFFLYRLGTDHPQKTHQLLSNGCHILFSGVSTYALPINGRPIVAHSLLWYLFTGLLPSNALSKSVTILSDKTVDYVLLYQSPVILMVTGSASCVAWEFWRLPEQQSVPPASCDSIFDVHTFFHCSISSQFDLRVTLLQGDQNMQNFVWFNKC
jgi:hypothetical protein